MKISEEFIQKIYQYGAVDFAYTEKIQAETFKEYSEWVESELHLPLKYLADERKEKRKALNYFWEPCASAIVFLFSYKNSHSYLNTFYNNDPSWNGLKIASYTLGFEGDDYHLELKKRLTSIAEELKKEHANLEYKISLDVHPVLDRDLAFRSGLGWYGKNSMLINRKEGSFTIIASLLLNIKLELPTKPLESDHCGQCTRCIEACPTQAIDPLTRTIVAQDCISTFTIEEFKLDTHPSEKMNLSSGFIFGCDICQDVCPWNTRIDRTLKNKEPIKLNSSQNKIIDFFLKTKATDIFNKIFSMSNKQFKTIFSNTSFERSGKNGLLKNLKLYLKQLDIFS